MLLEEKRQQLDSIVQQMVQNRETDDTIQFVVNDFKNRHSTEEPQESFLEKTANVTANVLDFFFGSGKVGEAIGTGIAKTKIGRKLVGAPELTEEEEKTIKGPKIGEVAGSALQSAALFMPVGTLGKGITAGARGLGMVKGVSALGKIGAGALAGELFDVASNLQQGKTGKEALTPGLGALIGGGIPALGVAKNVVVRFGEKQAPRVINSLIKPLAKDFSYGKNPGRAVAEEGIVANNFDDLIDKIRASRQKIGQSIGNLSSKLSEKPLLNIESALNPLDEATNVAAKQNNSMLLNRLNNVKRAITDVLEPVMDDTGNLGIKSVGRRNLDTLTFKETRNILSEIGDMTQFTGNPSDDKLVNSALKKVYGKIKETSLKYAEAVNPELAQEFSKLTEKYADLHSAEIAAKYRDKIVERANLIGFSPRNVGIGTGLITAIATGGATIPSVVVGISAATIDQLASTPGFKTRLAYLLSKKTQREASFLFQKIPALSKFFSTEKGIFPGDIILGENGEVLSRKIGEFIKKPKIGLTIEDVSILRGTKGMTAEDIMRKYPDIQLKRDVPATDIYGNKITIPEGEALTPYELKGNKILLQDGGTYIVSKNQFQNIKGNAVSGEAKPFAPELKGTEETIMQKENTGVIAEYETLLNKLKAKYNIDYLSPFDERLTSTESKALEKANNARIGVKDTTKFSQYQLPGGKNYREIIIKAPVKSGEPTFTSSHYPDEKNPISHLRIKEYDTKPYGQVTFMEEMQSDWAREGRTKGFIGERKQSFEQYLEELGKKYNIKPTDEAGFTRQKLLNKITNDEADKLHKLQYAEIPNNPLLKNWQELSVKRALKEAVDNNSEYLAWTTGEQQAARYNLAKEMNKIDWNGSGTNRKINLYPKIEKQITFNVENGKILSGSEFGMGGVNVPSDWVGKSLDQVIGRGVAEKILAEPKGNLSGEGLNIGGEWAKNLYDKQVKNIVEDVTGQKVQTIDMGLPIEGKVKTYYIVKKSGGFEDKLSSQNIKVGQKIADSTQVNNEYIITDILGDGKFKAVSKNTTLATIEPLTREKVSILDLLKQKKFKDIPDAAKSTFDISTKKSAGQQAIRLTDDIKRMVRGQSPILKTPSGITPK